MIQSIAKIHNEVYVHFPIAKEYEVTELWDNTTEVLSSEIKATVPSHGVKVFRVKAK